MLQQRIYIWMLQEKWAFHFGCYMGAKPLPCVSLYHISQKNCYQINKQISITVISLSLWYHHCFCASDHAGLQKDLLHWTRDSHLTCLPLNKTRNWVSQIESCWVRASSVIVEKFSLLNLLLHFDFLSNQSLFCYSLGQDMAEVMGYMHMFILSILQSMIW